MRSFLVITILMLASHMSALGQVEITSFASPYTQNFNSLSSSGSGNAWTDNTTLTGWYSTRTAYNAGTGSSATGALYSFGLSASSDRALGSIASGSTETIYYGLRLRNSTGFDVASIRVSYTGEQWRNSGSGSSQTLNFSYQVGSTVTDLTGGTYLPVSALNFASPITTGSPGALDGNLTANQTSSSVIILVTIPNGQEIMLRWEDPDDAGSDHGLAIDTVSVEASDTELPVQISLFTGRFTTTGQVLLEWTTLSEINNYGFHVERRSDQSPVFAQVNTAIIPGHGTTLIPQHYEYTDQVSGMTGLFYRLVQIDLDGTVHRTDEISVSGITSIDYQSPESFHLHQNFPNPFNPTTTITYSLPEDADVRIVVLDIVGREVMTLVEGEVAAGTHTMQLDATFLSSGVYFYRMEAGRFVSVRSMVILK